MKNFNCKMCNRSMPINNKSKSDNVCRSCYSNFVYNIARFYFGCSFKTYKTYFYNKQNKKEIKNVHIFVNDIINCMKDIYDIYTDDGE